MDRNADEMVQKIKATMSAEPLGALTEAEHLSVTSYLVTLIDAAAADTITTQAQLNALIFKAPNKPIAPVLPNVDRRKVNTYRLIKSSRVTQSSCKLHGVGRQACSVVKKGEHLWCIANADAPKEIANPAALTNVTLPRTGIPTRAY